LAESLATIEGKMLISGVSLVARKLAVRKVSKNTKIPSRINGGTTAINLP
jgi:hypothetical protein